jgi:hypothetical protein
MTPWYSHSIVPLGLDKFEEGNNAQMFARPDMNYAVSDNGIAILITRKPNEIVPDIWHLPQIQTT